MQNNQNSNNQNPNQTGTSGSNIVNQSLTAPSVINLHNLISNKQKTRQRALMLAAVLLIMGFILPTPEGLTTSGMKVGFIFAATLVLWLKISIDWPSLLALTGLSLIPELGMKKVLAASFGTPIVLFLIGTFICTYALTTTSLLKRFTYKLITRKWAQKSSFHFFVAYLAAVFCLGLFMSPTILFVLYLPIYREVRDLFNLPKGSHLAQSLLMGQVFICALTSGLTPISHVFPVLALDYLQQNINTNVSYGHYMLITLPFGLLGFLILIGALGYWSRSDFHQLDSRLDLQVHDEFLQQLKSQPLAKREYKIMAIFSMVVLLFLLPDLNLYLNWALLIYLQKLGTAFPALIGSLALFMITDRGQSLLDFKTALKEGVNFSSILMCATTLAVGAACTDESLQIAGFLKMNFALVSHNLSPMLLILLIAVWAGLQTNFASNIVTVSLLSAVALPLALQTQGEFLAAIAALMIGLMASLSFATPAAHPNVALALSNNDVEAMTMFKAGLLYLGALIILAMLVVYPLAILVLG